MLQVEKVTELLMLVSYLMVNCTLKILKGISVECMECLNKDAKKKKKEKSCTLRVGMIKSLPVPDCLILCMSLMDSVQI